MKLQIDFNKKIGEIKPMHGIGQPPILGTNDRMFHYLSEAGIPYSRLHDVGGAFGGNLYVDIHNIFRDFDADEQDEASYDFTFTDWLLQALLKQNCEPIFRLGETIENYHYIKAYRIFPPKDPAKWARICEKIIRHYNEGWANGFHMGIQYWEIWNEPDNGRDDSENQMWHGTKEEFYELYTVTAKHLKAVFGDAIKVGGYATCGFRHILSDPEKFGIDCEKSDDECYASGRSANFIDFFEGFFTYIKKYDSPIDFFSWHSYLSTDNTVICAGYLDRRLKELGYGNLETQLNEWNNVCEDRGNPLLATRQATEEWGTGMAAAKTASMMCAMQYTGTKILCYYDARVGTSYYGGMFNPLTKEPFPAYYAFKAFNELYQLKNQVECTWCDKQGTSGGASASGSGVYVLAAERDGKKAVLLSNISQESAEISVNLSEDMTAYIVDNVRALEAVPVDKTLVIPSGTLILVKN